ncbi:hypothetical protein F3R65_22040 [Salmonella enterica subsp. enterica]|nr:hypothetical protein [Salmonella enterica]ECW0844207.1 hypothetical protein [Salmonella enterica subsp. enterica]EDD9544613.1 hypothetical protein [Salmonella enterica subsp. enterica serovar Rissen]EDK1754325.1 hypothetical protein [Salmonella enterica subsp. enterica serovar Mississippi]EDP9848944.1 hypothetical protein [Salmonella enterica subsp. enterica serovar Arechavaleta]
MAHSSRSTGASAEPVTVHASRNFSPRESDFHQEKFQSGSGENGPGTQRRKLYFTGESTAAQTANCLQPVICGASHDV